MELLAFVGSVETECAEAVVMRECSISGEERFSSSMMVQVEICFCLCLTLTTQLLWALTGFGVVCVSGS